MMANNNLLCITKQKRDLESSQCRAIINIQNVSYDSSHDLMTGHCQYYIYSVTITLSHEYVQLLETNERTLKWLKR